MTRVAHSRVLIRIFVPVGLAVVLVILALTGALATVKPIGEATTVAAIQNGGVAFNKVKYVDSIWKSRVLPALRNNAIPIDTLVKALEKNPSAAEKEYGHDVAGAYNFLVSFTGKVSKVDTSTPVGMMTVNVPFSGAMLPVKVQVGPVILGTSLRDALKFISFGQFLNQVQFGSAGEEINTRVAQTIKSELDLKTVSGKTITVRGAFTYDGTNPKDLQVTPVIVKVE